MADDILVLVQNDLTYQMGDINLQVKYDKAPKGHVHIVYKGEVIGFPILKDSMTITIAESSNLTNKYYINLPSTAHYVFSSEKDGDETKKHPKGGKIELEPGVPKWKFKVKYPSGISGLPITDNVTVGDEPP